MNKQKRLAIVIIGLVGILAMPGCSTTDVKLKPSEETFRHHGIDKGDRVIIHFANPANPNASDRSETVRITQVSRDEIEGINDSGNRVAAKYDEIYRVQGKSRVGTDITTGTSNTVAAAYGVFYLIGGIFLGH